MWWLVEGYDRESGEQRRVRMEAESEESVVRKAGDAGIVVSHVERTPEPRRNSTSALPADAVSTSAVDVWIFVVHAAGVLLIAIGGLTVLVWLDSSSYSATAAQQLVEAVPAVIGALLLIAGLLCLIYGTLLVQTHKRSPKPKASSTSPVSGSR